MTEAPRSVPAWLIQTLFCALLTCALAIGMRLLEWPCWQNPEYRLGNEMLLATHDAYHWLAGAVGFGRATDHPMSVMLRWMAGLLHANPANVAFWFPAVLSGMAAGVVFIWGWMLGSMETGIAAGLIASISPGFLGRTLLGYYDTDLVTLFFPLLISVFPAFWCMRFILLYFGNRKKAPARAMPFAGQASEQLATNPLAPLWLCLLALAGLLSCWTQQWHSVFPYIIRYNVVLLLGFALLYPPRELKCAYMAGALAYALPALQAWGIIWPLFLLCLTCLRQRMPDRKALYERLLNWSACLMLLPLLALLAGGDLFNILVHQINAYLKHSADTHASGGVPLMFPSVAQSIVEVQDLSLAALFPYFHPWLEAGIAGFAGFCLVLARRPCALFLLPLAALALLSSRLGGRMVMFGAPITALGLTVPCYWLLRFALKRWLGPAGAGRLACLMLCAVLVLPFIDMIPALSQGPVINRRHAAALAQAEVITPRDSLLWLWWDWGYAAHYFARRETIADGAEHGGPSLYLPAAVFASPSPRFARQIIRYTSSKGNIAGNVFKGLDAVQAQNLLTRLRSPEEPLVRGKGRQYLLTSFEMLRLGFWISNYGNWNFISRQGEGSAISIVTRALAYRLSTGEVRLEGSRNIILPTSISVFEETGIIQRNYVREWFAAHPGASAAQQKALLESRRNINFLFNRVTDEKLAMDEGMYNSLMVRLLLCDPQDPDIAPYFRLVYDNVFARLYEVLPAQGETRDASQGEPRDLP